MDSVESSLDGFGETLRLGEVLDFLCALGTEVAFCLSALAVPIVKDHIEGLQYSMHVGTSFKFFCSQNVLNHYGDTCANFDP